MQHGAQVSAGTCFITMESLCLCVATPYTSHHRELNASNKLVSLVFRNWEFRREVECHSIGINGQIVKNILWYAWAARMSAEQSRPMDGGVVTDTVRNKMKVEWARCVCVCVCVPSARISICGMNLNWGSRILSRTLRIYEIAIIIIINTKKFRSILQQLYHWIPCELWIEEKTVRSRSTYTAQHRKFRIRSIHSNRAPVATDESAE